MNHTVLPIKLIMLKGNCDLLESASKKNHLFPISWMESPQSPMFVLLRKSNSLCVLPFQFQFPISALKLSSDHFLSDSWGNSLEGLQGGVCDCDKMVLRYISHLFVLHQRLFKQGRVVHLVAEYNLSTSN